MNRPPDTWRRALIRRCFLSIVSALLTYCAVGCAANSPSSGWHAPSWKLSTDDVGAGVIAVADTFIGRMSQACDDLEAESDNPEVRHWARANKVGQSLAVLTVATGRNPYANA